MSVFSCLPMCVCVCRSTSSFNHCVFWSKSAFRLGDLHMCCHQLQWWNIVECFFGSQRYDVLDRRTVFMFKTASIFFNLTNRHFDYALFDIPLESVGVTVSKNQDENELPGPPSKPQVTDVTKNSVSLSWQQGTPGASPVSSFVIEAFRSVMGQQPLSLVWLSSTSFFWVSILRFRVFCRSLGSKS